MTDETLLMVIRFGVGDQVSDMYMGTKEAKYLFVHLHVCDCTLCMYYWHLCVYVNGIFLILQKKLKGKKDLCIFLEIFDSFT